MKQLLSTKSNTGRQPNPTPLRTGILWNLIALIFLAFAGIALNILISRLYNPETLGLFNIVFALFILASQLTTFGLQLATLQAVSTSQGDMNSVSLSIRSAFIGASIASAALIPLFLIATPLLSLMYSNVENIEMAWLVAVPGLYFFSMNKIQLAAVNGLHQMKTFALFQATRFLFILFILGGLVLLNAKGWMLPVVLTLAEFLLFPLLLFYLYRIGALVRTQTSLRETIFARIRFGFRVFVSGTLAELNTRVDVLMLGIHVSVTEVGIYSVAILIFDAATQFIYVVRNNINPMIALSVASGNSNDMTSLSRKSVFSMMVLYSAIASGLWLLFPLLIGFILPDPLYTAAREPVTILLLGLAMAGGVMAFNQVLSQSNLPGWQSLFVLAVVVVNVAANAVFIPLFGISGAALGTITALCSSAALTIILSRWLTGLRIVF